jgi:hypothetical protein
VTESDALQKKEEERKKGRKEERKKGRKEERKKGTERYIYISMMTANPVNRRLKVPPLKVKYCVYSV